MSETTTEKVSAPEIDLPEDEERLEPIEHNDADDVKMADAANDDLQIDISASQEPFYLRYYSGHQGRYGHEFFEFDLQVQDEGKYAMLRYANNSNYRQEGLIKKSVALSPTVFKEFKRILTECEILKEDDKLWPSANRDGKQELELRLGRFHISFETAKIGSMNEVQQSRDPEGLRVFYYAVQDLKALVFSLVQCHFKIKPFSA